MSCMIIIQGRRMARWKRKFWEGRWNTTYRYRTGRPLSVALWYAKGRNTDTHEYEILQNPLDSQKEVKQESASRGSVHWRSGMYQSKLFPFLLISSSLPSLTLILTHSHHHADLYCPLCGPGRQRHGRAARGYDTCDAPRLTGLQDPK
jgi:hypothetical protein